MTLSTLQIKELCVSGRPNTPARSLKRFSPHQGELPLPLLCVVTDRRTGSEDFSEEIRTFKSKIEGWGK